MIKKNSFRSQAIEKNVKAISKKKTRKKIKERQKTIKQTVEITYRKRNRAWLRETKDDRSRSIPHSARIHNPGMHLKTVWEGVCSQGKFPFRKRLLPFLRHLDLLLRVFP